MLVRNVFGRTSEFGSAIRDSAVQTKHRGLLSFARARGLDRAEQWAASIGIARWLDSIMEDTRTCEIFVVGSWKNEAEGGVVIDNKIRGLF